jgi:hypothetical protein
MPFWRREKPLHERLAEQGGLTVAREVPHDTMPRWGESGIHGMHRPRRWDAVLTAEAEAPGDEIHFATLPDGTLIVNQEGVPDGALTPLAEAVETALEPPYRAEAVRRDNGVWAIGASRIQVAHVPDEIGGNVVEMAVQQGERTLLVDGARTFGSIPTLEALGAGMTAFVVRAERLDGDVWEVTVAPL